MISMLILSDEFGDLPVRASQSKNLLQDGVFIASTTVLLEAYGAPRYWRWVMWHGVFINLTIVCCHLRRRSRLHLTLDRVSLHNNSSSSIRVDSRHDRYTNYTACRWPIRPLRSAQSSHSIPGSCPIHLSECSVLLLCSRCVSKLSMASVPAPSALNTRGACLVSSGVSLYDLSFPAP